MQTTEERNFYVVQTQGPYRNEIGEMTETVLYGHVGTRLGSVTAAEAVLRELEEKGTATIRFTNSLGPETTMEIRRLMATETVTSPSRGNRKFANGARVRGREEGAASFRGRTGTVTGYVPNSGYWVCFDDGRIENVPAHWLEAA
jgi:hypothetical protein